MELVSFIPFTDIVKLVLAEAKKVRDFKPLIEDLASTIERLVPIFEEIDLLKGRLDPGNKDLIFITKLMLRAKKMVHECTQVRLYNIPKIKSYTKKIKELNGDFMKFCQLDLQLIQYRNQLRTCSVTSLLKIEESPPPGLEGQHRVSFNEGKVVHVQEDEQLSVALKESLHMKELLLRKAEELSSREAEELKSAIQESVSFHRQHEEQAAKRKLEEQRIVWESFKDKGKAKKVQEDEKSLINTEDLSLRAAISISQREGQMAKKRARELKIDEQRVLLESFKTK